MYKKLLIDRTGLEVELDILTFLLLQGESEVSTYQTEVTSSAALYARNLTTEMSPSVRVN